MKRVICILFLVFIAQLFCFADNPSRDATPVNDVFKPFDPKVWIVSVKEEPKGDQQVKNAPECDIKGVIAAVDGDRLRFDILLHNPVLGELKTWFGIRLEYDDGYAEYFVYKSDTQELMYLTEQDGEIQKTEILDQDVENGDFAQLTASSGKKNTAVTIVINKELHISGDKGERYFLSCNFETGFFDEEDNISTADETIKVDVYFEK